MADGAITWFELDVPDIAGAQEFYGAVCPWTFQPMEGYEGYAIIQVEGSGVGALQASDAGQPSGRAVRQYVQVADLEDTLARVERGGGSVDQGRMPVPGDQWLALARDPYGLKIGFVTNNAAR